MASSTEDRPAPVGSTRLRLLARVIFGLTILGIAAGIWFSILDAGGFETDLAFLLSFCLFPIIGYILAIRRPDNAISWLMLGIGAAFGLSAFVESYASYAIHGGVGGFRLGAIALAFDQPMWVPIVSLPATFLILLFPDGHLPSPRWRWFAWVLGISMAITFLAILFGPGRLEESPFPGVVNPLGSEALRPVLVVATASIVMLPIGVIGSLVSLVQRFRRSTGIERLQLRWLVTAAGTVATLYASALVLSFNASWGTEATPAWLGVIQVLAIVSFGMIPIAIGISVLRYHLFDIDLVINKALLLAAMVVFITLVYVAIVVGVGALVGSQSTPVLSAVAAAVVALAFQPARRRAQRFADRLVYGKRATPYEVLSQFSDRLGNAYANEELLPRMARALAEGTGASRADVWVRVGDELRADAMWPPDPDRPEHLVASDNAEASLSSSSMREPVRHRGELLGALSITKKPGESITATEEKLVRDLAAQAGLVMRNVALAEQLMDTIEQLRASRQRLVTAQDERAKQLERNLHDGAQQQIVALTVKLRLLGQLMDRDVEKAKSMASDLQTDATDALEQLRDLARGIYPPLLADQGLVAALEAQARKASVPTEFRSDGIGRYPQDIEAAVYFCVLEALNNVAKYAEATRAEVSLAQDDGQLRFAVVDDGTGFDTAEKSYGTGVQGMADRLDAIGGALEVVSRKGDGTTIEGRIPTPTSSEPGGRGSGSSLGVGPRTLGRPDPSE
jgi:signal transduction histidine kinase